MGSENAGIAAGGGGVELGGLGLGGVELDGVLAGRVVVVTAADTGGATVVDVVEGVTPYAAAGADSDATTTATRATPPREHPNIAVPVGIRAPDLQGSPQIAARGCRNRPI